VCVKLGEDSTGAYNLYCSTDSFILYTVTFDINGGSGTTPPSKTNVNSSYITLPGDGSLLGFASAREGEFSKSGYRFGGWNTDPSGTGDNYTNTYSINKDITLYAKWISMSAAEANPIKLTENTWLDGSITASDGEVWYVFDVSAYNTYYVWWNEKYCDGTKTMNIKVDMYYSDGTLVFSGDEAWIAPKQFTAVYITKVKLKVYPDPNSSYNTGTFAIVFSRNSTRPGSSVPGASGSQGNPILLTSGKWLNENITSTASGNIRWYYFNVNKGTTYYIWWNEKGINGGDGGATADITVYASYSSGGSIFTGDIAWSTPKSFIANLNGTVYLMVYAPTDEGTYAIVYSTRNTKP